MADFPKLGRQISLRGFNRAMQSLHGASDPQAAGLAVEPYAGSPIMVAQPERPAWCYARIIALVSQEDSGLDYDAYTWIEETRVPDVEGGAKWEDKDPGIESTRKSDNDSFLNLAVEANGRTITLPNDAHQLLWTGLLQQTDGQADNEHIFYADGDEEFANFTVAGSGNPDMDITLSLGVASANIVIDGDMVQINRSGWYKFTWVCSVHDAGMIGVPVGFVGVYLSGFTISNELAAAEDNWGYGDGGIISGEAVINTDFEVTEADLPFSIEFNVTNTGTIYTPVNWTINDSECTIDRLGDSTS